MGFYARALLRDSHEFGLRGLIEFAASEGMEIRVEPPSALKDAGWSEAELWAPWAEVPVEIDVSRRGDPDSLLAEEIAEFEEELEDGDEQVEGGIAKVRDHLAGSRAIVAIRVLGSDDRDGPAIGRCVLGWYGRRDDVLLQVDDEGFYDGDRLIVGL